MGGRGASSFGSKNHGGMAASSALSDRQISARISQLDAEISSLEGTMERLGRKSSWYLQGAPWATRTDHEQYVAARDKYQELRSERSSLAMEQVKRKSVTQESKTKAFVNSFGEATDRYVTSGTYERAMKRQEKQIAERMKGFR